MIILLTGKAGVGKSEVARYLAEQHHFKVEALAAPLKRLVNDVFRVPMVQLEPVTAQGRLRREEPTEHWPDWTPRKLLQYIGTEMFRKEFGDDVWVRSLLLRMAEQPPETNWVIQDCRFPNEQQLLQAAFPGQVVTIRIERPGFDGQVGLAQHVSEQHTLPANGTVWNDATLSVLFNRVAQTLGIFRVLAPAQVGVV